MGIKNKKLILSVEDHAPDQVALERTLETIDIDCEFITAGDGIEAIKMMDCHSAQQTSVLATLSMKKPDVVLMDINMPNMDGKQTLVAMRQSSALQDIPVIMLTSSENDKDHFESLRLGVNAYIKKPATKKDLSDALEVLGVC